MSALPPKIEALHSRIERSEILTEDEKDVLMRFSSKLGVHNYSTGRRAAIIDQIDTVLQREL
jgi:hypothetical protein